MQYHGRHQSRCELTRAAPLPAFGQVYRNERSNRRYTPVHYGRAETTHQPNAEASTLEHFQVRNVFDEGESGAYGEPTDGRIYHEGDARRGDQKNPEGPLGQFLHYGRPKTDVQGWVFVHVPKNSGVDSVA